jgi:DNA recombination protein RmuC
MILSLKEIIFYILIIVSFTIFITIFIIDIWYKQQIDKFKLLQEEEKRVLQEHIQILKQEIQQLQFNSQIKTIKIQEMENLNKNINQLFTEQFTNISNKALNDQTDSFFKKIDFFFQQSQTKQKDNASDFNKLLNPLVDSIREFQNRTLAVEKDRIISNESIKDSLKTLTSAYMGLKETTALLTSSHKSSGQWGEIQLKRLLEYTGLIKYCEFDTQVAIETSEGVFRPDVIVYLPDNISLAIDAKTPLISYAKIANSTNEEEKKKYRKEFSRSIKAHITALGTKQYWLQFPNAPEMVLMFLPCENYWQIALDEDESIIEYAYRSNVVVTTPLTLIPLLRIVASIWGKFQISREAEDLKNKSMFLYENMIKLTNLLYDFGKNLETNQKIYNKILTLERDIKPNIENFRETFFPLLPSLKILKDD